MTRYGSGHGGLEGVLLINSFPDHVFEGKSKRIAREARDTMITDPSQFDADERLAIVIRFRDREIYQVRRGGAWVDVCVMTTDEDDDENQ